MATEVGIQPALRNDVAGKRVADHDAVGPDLARAGIVDGRADAGEIAAAQRGAAARP